jgi:hypothetical protein
VIRTNSELLITPTPRTDKPLSYRRRDLYKLYSKLLACYNDFRSAVVRQAGRSQQLSQLRKVLQPLTSPSDSVYDAAGKVIETHEHAGEVKRVVSLFPSHHVALPAKTDSQCFRFYRAITKHAGGLDGIIP